MSSHSTTLADSEMLPRDEVSVFQQHSEWRPAGPRKFSNRIYRARFAVAWLALILIGASIIWSLTWIRPQQRIRLSLIGGSYADNLSVDHNVFGWNDLSEMASLAHQDTDLNQYYVAGLPVVFNQNTEWDATLEKADEETIVVYFSAHGAADEHGPFLMPVDCQPGVDARLNVETIIERLSRVPAHKKKLLILDASHFRANWRYGILHNDFARALQGLNEKIVAVPNLVVLSAAGEDQLAWNCLSQYQSAFGHFFVEGIRGAAADQNNNGRIDAQDVFQFTELNVHQWVQTTFQKTQRPFLLPVGTEGLHRASQLELAACQKNYQAPLAQTAERTSDAQLRKIWNSHNALLARPAKPYIYAPGRWRKYEQSILRYEQLIQSNDLLSANQMVEQISSLQHHFEWDLERSLAATHGNLFIGKSILGQAGNSEQAQQITDLLWTAAPNRYAAIWNHAVSKSEAKDISLLRIEVLTLLYERAMSNPINSLSKSANIALQVLDPLEPAPAEINFLLMLDKHLPAATRNQAAADLVRTSLAVRLQAEQVAVTFESDSRASSEGIFPWIANDVLAADLQRQLGEDLLFAGTAEHDRARGYFEQARQLYSKAQLRGERVREAYLLSHDFAYRLPHLSNWIANICSGDSPDDRERLKSFEDLVLDAHRLNLLLEQQNPDCFDNPLLDSKNSELPCTLADQTDRVSNELSLIQKRFDDWWIDQSAVQSPDLWQDITLALSIPHGRPETRSTLLTNQMSLILHSPISYAKYDSSGRSSVVGGHVVDPVKLKHDSLIQAQAQGRIALAMIGQQAFDRSRVETQDSFEQLRHRLNVLGTEEHWWKSMHIAGDQIQSTLNHLLDDPQDFSGASDKDFQDLKAAAVVNGFLGGDGRAISATNPNATLRDWHQSRLFGGLSQRTLNDHWYDIDGRPYYLEAARRYLQTATRLWQQNSELAELEAAVRSPAGLKLISPLRIDLTTEAELPFRIGLQSETQAQQLTGFPLLWLEGSQAISLTRPVVGEKLVQKLIPGETPSPESCLLQNPIESDANPGSELGANEFEISPFHRTSHRKLSIDQSDSSPSVRVTGFFRGQPLSSTIDVHLHRAPDVLNLAFEKPTTARVAVLTSDKLQNVHGIGAGAIAIVIDASGSMGAAAGKNFDESTKYAEATRAIRDVLESLPDGIQISIWVFGQAVGTQKTVLQAEQTIQRIVRPTKWQRADSGQLEAIMKNISWPNVEPWNESPIVETVLAAKQDVVGKPGFKSVLLLTDGIDNRYETRAGEEPQPSVADALRTAFDKTGVALNVVGFKVTSQEQQATRAQYKLIETFSPAGKFFEVRDAQRLADTLKSVLHERIRYWIDDYANGSLDGNDRTALEVGLTGSGLNWYPQPLNPGSYLLWTNASKTPFSLLLNRGDQLVVELNQKDHHLVCHRASILDVAFPNKPSKTAARWKIAALENRLIETSNELSMLVGMEQVTTRDPTAVELVQPYDVWFEVREPGNGTVKQPITWHVDHSFTVPAWRLTVSDWHQRQAGHLNSPVSPRLDVWWSPDRSTAPAVRLERGRDYDKIAQLAGHKMDVDGVEVHVESVLVENRVVQTNSKTREFKSCLVVRLKHDPDHKYWARPIGMDFEGREERTYQKIGCYTGVFWPVTKDQVDQVVSGLNVLALDDLKRQAESRGFHVQLDNLRSPRPDDIAFPPLNGSQTQ